MLIYNTLVNFWGTNVDELYVIAAENTYIMLQGVFRSMDNVIMEFESTSEQENYMNLSKLSTQDEQLFRREYPKLLSKQIETEIFNSSQMLPMYVITNCEKTFGAACILYPLFLKEIATQLDDDLYILPSSIHECIIVPVGNGYRHDKSNLSEMVTDTNKDCVSPEEILSSSVYIYSRSLDQIML